MYKIFKKLNGIRAVVAAGVCFLTMGRALAGDTASGVPVIHDSARLFEDEGPIMYMDQANRIMIIKEIQHVVGPFVVDGVVHTTRLVDAKGNILDFKHFEERQWVMVRGYRVAKSKIYLLTVRPLNGAIEKENRIVERLEPIE